MVPYADQRSDWGYLLFFESVSNTLILYCRQLAYLGATPDKMKQSRLEQIQGNALRERDEDGSAITGPAEVHLPEVDSAFAHLLVFFFDAGQAMKTGMGITELTWQEIKAWREETETDITLWEKEQIKKMSQAYCAEYHAASDPKRPAPYQPEVEEEEIDHIGKALGFMEQMKLLKRN